MFHIAPLDFIDNLERRASPTAVLNAVGQALKAFDIDHFCLNGELWEPNSATFMALTCRMGEPSTASTPDVAVPQQTRLRGQTQTSNGDDRERGAEARSGFRSGLRW